MFKRIFAAVVLAAAHALSVAAGGAWDGIYQCNTTFAGRVIQGYAAINGHPDGRAVVTFPAFKAIPDVYGYGIGVVAGNQFTGTSDLGTNFAFTASPTGFSGTFGLVSGGRVVTLSVSCILIW